MPRPGFPHPTDQLLRDRLKLSSQSALSAKSGNPLTPRCGHHKRLDELPRHVGWLRFLQWTPTLRENSFFQTLVGLSDRLCEGPWVLRSWKRA